MLLEPDNYATNIADSHRPGKELQQMLKEHGDFGTLEVQIAKKHVKSDKKKQLGGWYSKGFLEKTAHWNKT